ncbi:NUDIX hydrolase [Streptomyces sp. TLI_171]|uniref:NUDIX hydrolase n=1 Tax=Streptomyces sp. TLI_171 TaxID=1938859 RepID=UPI000C195E24|nr:NUDIX hydrolase [Streptomyces sp. TLI_171]RKE18275.1 AAA domain-containing protein [Streptomyces sp. TLI_171]
MIVWVNGAFGAGKTSACRELVGLLPGSLLFEPDTLATVLRATLPPDRVDVPDLRVLPAWRRLVAETAAALAGEIDGAVIVPETLLDQDHRDEIFGSLAGRGLPVHHVVLDPVETILRARIATREDVPGDPEATQRLRQRGREALPGYLAARGWLAGDARMVDNGVLTPRQTAERIADLVRSGAARCPIVRTEGGSGDTVAAAVLLFDDRDRVLLVDPAYKPHWEFPGGVVESGESPTAAAVREVAEELGLRLDPEELRLLAVDWESGLGRGRGGLRLVYDGGRLGPSEVLRLRLPAGELRDWHFATRREAAELLPAGRMRRLAAALEAREAGDLRYLEGGRPAATGAAAGR